MNRQKFETGGIYHIFNRGTDKRTIFLDTVDFTRFLQGVYDFNDAMPARDPRYAMLRPQPREKLVEILCYCLMPNHFHFMLRQVRDNGVTLFMQKLGTGYTMYFNKKYDRSGVLFQGQFKSILIDNDTYLAYLPHYIHANPVELSMDARESLQNYHWSSYSSYVNERKDTFQIIDAEFLQTLYIPNGYGVAFHDWMNAFNPRESVLPVALD